jgi:FHA domain
MVSHQNRLLPGKGYAWRGCDPDRCARGRAAARGALEAPAHRGGAKAREHCEILLQADQALVRDLGSSNGTYINRQRVQEAPLAAGDLLGVGPAVFAIRIDGKPVKVDPKDARARGSAPEPAVAAAAAPQARPAAPAKAGAKPSAKPGAATPKPVAAKADDSADSSVDFDFDEFLKDDEDAKL